MVNIMEHKAMWLALINRSICLHGPPRLRVLRVQSDNVEALAYINHQEGTRNGAAQEEVE